jgi:AraC-like DNA-binding protein
MSNEIHQKLIQIIKEFAPHDGFHQTAIPLIQCIKFSNPRPRARTTWRSSLVIVVQGHKEITLESNVFQYSGPHYIVSAVDLPVSSSIPFASPSEPFLAIRILIDSLEFHQIGSKMNLTPSSRLDMKTHGLFTGLAEIEILDCIVRLAKLFKNADDAKILGPMIVQELFYHLLKTKDGPAIRQFTAKGTKLHGVSESIRVIKSDLSEKVDVEKLAKSVHMSRTAFFSSFKLVTAMSPIQYQKKLRLMEARQILMNEEETAESAAFKVGYKSASQFSREYTRMFGNPPGRDMKRSSAPSIDSASLS